MPTPEKQFGERVRERAETYKTKSKELFDKVAGRVKKALEFLKGAPFLAAAFAVEAGIEAANKGREAVRKGVKAIEDGASEAMKFGRDKKDQAVNFLSGIFEAAKKRVKDARDALVNRVNEARRRVGERIDQIREARERARREAEIRKLEETLKRIEKSLEELSQAKSRIEAHLARLRQLEQPQTTTT
jgi:DNA repair exonuclease SbcCD ATPase subunit